MTVVADFASSAARSPDRVFLHAGERDYTYGEILRWSVAITHALADQRVRPGDRVALVLGNTPAYVSAYFGTLMAGALVVALDPTAPARELTARLRHSDACCVVVEGPGPRGWREARPASPVQWEIAADQLPRASADLSAPAGRAPGPDDPAQIVYTSGTTGRPKGVLLSHRNLAANVRAILARLDLGPDENLLVTLPFRYAYGNSLLLTHAAVGARLVLADQTVFWNRIVDLMEAQAVTGFAGVPSSYAMLLNRGGLPGRALPHLRYLTCAGGALPPPLVQRVQAAFPHARLFLMYGLTEATARLAILMPEELAARPRSVGRPVPGVTVVIVRPDGQVAGLGEEGEIVARGDNVMLGYWRDPGATRQALRAEGLFTGDLGRLDGDGFLYVTGRRSDLIKTGGYRVEAAELEELLLEIGGVEEAAVVGAPDATLDEVPVAFIVASEAAPDADAILLACNRQLPPHKHLRRVRRVEALPRTASGKVHRAALRALCDREAPPLEPT